MNADLQDYKHSELTEKTLLNEHESQLLNYLNATNIEVGLLLNFGPKPEIKRKAFNNNRKISC